jgi:hypothetical protein
VPRHACKIEKPHLSDCPPLEKLNANRAARLIACGFYMYRTGMMCKSGIKAKRIARAIKANASLLKVGDRQRANLSVCFNIIV